MRIGLGLVVCLVTLTACGVTTTSRTPSDTATAAAPSLPGFASPAASPDPGVSVTDATYGSLAVQTTSGALCSAEVQVTAGDYGEPPLKSLPQQAASAGGIVRWSYSAPRVPKTTGLSTVTCQSGALSGTATATFDTSRRAMTATDLAVHVTTATPPQPSFTPDASLVGLRDAVADRIRSTLSAEWKKATRGLGNVRLVDGSQDISIFVVAAGGISVHRQSRRDGSEDIVIVVDDRLGRINPENGVATALHELGHIWCCYGPDADDGGHWKVKLRDPGLYGVDKYGLMTDPVSCISFANVLSCPNRFSDREMTALGFSSFPPPAPDPCVTQALSLQSQTTSLSAQIAAQKANLATLDAQIKSIERQYPNGIPPALFANYQSLITQFNALAARTTADADRYNGLVDQLNALPCDTS